MRLLQLILRAYIEILHETFPIHACAIVPYLNGIVCNNDIHKSCICIISIIHKLPDKLYAFSIELLAYGYYVALVNCYSYEFHLKPFFSKKMGQPAILFCSSILSPPALPLPRPRLCRWQQYPFLHSFFSWHKEGLLVSLPRLRQWDAPVQWRRREHLPLPHLNQALLPPQGLTPQMPHLSQTGQYHLA